MADIPPENDPALDAFAAEELPWENVDASRRNRRLQAKHPVAQGKNCYPRGGQGLPEMPDASGIVELVLFR